MRNLGPISSITGGISGVGSEGIIIRVLYRRKHIIGAYNPSSIRYAITSRGIRIAASASPARGITPRV